MAALLPEFCEEFNSRDARFLGSPLDFVVFRRLEEGDEVRRIVFVEVKDRQGKHHETRAPCP
jgi:predicted Holliday junction resolvase-like endonuclease